MGHCRTHKVRAWDLLLGRGMFGQLRKKMLSQGIYGCDLVRTKFLLLGSKSVKAVYSSMVRLGS